MNVTECLERQEELARFLELDTPISIEDLSWLEEGIYAVAGKVVLPCLPAARFGSPGGDRDNPILDIPIELEGEQVGLLCLSSRLKDLGVDASAVTDAQKQAILRLASSVDFDAGGAAMLNLKLDCAVIEKEKVESFFRHRSTSAVWGGFVLKADEIPLENFVVDIEQARIEVIDLDSPRTNRHRGALQRATESSIVVDRFLHLYHFLELDYDHEIVRRIREISPENTRGLEKLLVTGRAELERLYLVSEGFSQFDELERIAGLLKPHRETALAVFYDYGKEQNPLKERIAFEQQFLDSAIVTRQVLNEIKRSQGLESNFARDESTYRDMLVKLACYWTYRIRCCIAHNKLGEYHLQSASDMRFVGEFGEPLITALIVHRLRTQPQTSAAAAGI